MARYSTILPFSTFAVWLTISKPVIEQVLLDHSAEPLEAKIYSRISSGSMEKALRLVEEGRLETREHTLEFLKILINEKDLKFIEFSNNFKRSNTRSQLKEIISHLVLWVADLAYYKYDQDEIVNLDRTDLIEALYKKNPAVEDYLSELTNFLETMIGKLDANVNQQLILIEIYNVFKETFFGKV